MIERLHEHKAHSNPIQTHTHTHTLTHTTTFCLSVYLSTWSFICSAGCDVSVGCM